MRGDLAEVPEEDSTGKLSKMARATTWLSPGKPLLDWRGWLALGWSGWFGLRYLGMVLDERAPGLARAVGRWIGG